MRESAALREPVLDGNAASKPREGDDNAAGKPREGIVVSTVLRLTTSDGERFEDIGKAMEHEAFYQILKRLVKELGWSDDEETATFALKLARHYASLLPVLNQIEADDEALRAHLKTFQHAQQD
jgi:hypothetical protein